MSDVAIILNPAARGARNPADRDRLIARIREVRPDAGLRLTAHSGDAVRIVRELVGSGIRELIAVGGDGTLHEVVNGIGEAGALDGSVNVTPINAGTGGDFRRLLGRRGAAEHLGEVMEQPIRRMDVGHVRFRALSADGDPRRAGDLRPAQRWFFNIASTGMSGLVDRHVNASGKRLGGTLTFGLATLRAFFQYRAPRVRIVIDDEDLGELNLQAAVAANGQFFGGGMHIAAGAKVDDGLLDFIVIEDGPVLRQLVNMPRLYRGEVEGAKGVRHVRGERMFVEPLSDEGVAWMDLDGEAPGIAPADFRVVPAALGIRDVIPDARRGEGR